MKLWVILSQAICIAMLCGCAAFPKESTSSTSGAVAADAISPKLANANRRELDQSRVVLSGLLVYDGYSYGIWGSVGAFESGRIEECVTPLATGKISRELYSRSGEFVVLEGTFVSNYTRKEIVVSGGCNFSGLRVLSVWSLVASD